MSQKTEADRVDQQSSKGAFLVVEEFERRLASYAGAPFAVAVDSCTNALFLSFLLDKERGATEASLPKRTYVGVAQAARNAGLKIRWREEHWRGFYEIHGTSVIDSARRLYRGMYWRGTLMCLSFQASKHLPIGRGGAILCEEAMEAEWLRAASFDGRTRGLSIQDPASFVPGYHMYMTPEQAARGLWLMMSLKDDNPDLPGEYQDLSKIPLFQ